MPPLIISYTTSKNWQRRGEQRTLTKHILLSLGWWVRTDNSDDGGVCARIHGCLLFKSSCLILLLRPSSQQIFRESFMLKTTTTTKNQKMESIGPHLRTVQDVLDIKPCWLGTAKWGFGQPLFTQDARALQMPLHSPTPTPVLGRFYTGIIIYYLLFIFSRGCPPSQRPKWSIKKWNASQNW